MARRGTNSVDKAKDFKGTLNKLLKRVSAYKILIILSFVFAIGSTIFAIISPKILGNATTEIFNGLILKISGTGGIDFNTIKNILITLGILYIISAIFLKLLFLIQFKVLKTVQPCFKIFRQLRFFIKTGYDIPETAFQLIAAPFFLCPAGTA